MRVRHPKYTQRADGNISAQRMIKVMIPLELTEFIMARDKVNQAEAENTIMIHIISSKDTPGWDGSIATFVPRVSIQLPVFTPAKRKEDAA